MKSDASLLNRYWSDAAKIKEARQIFFDKGVIRRELIANDLAFSWLRCKYKNVDPVNVPERKVSSNALTPPTLIPNGVDLMRDIWAGLFDDQGKLLRFMGDSVLCQQFSNWSFNEIHAGFNGIGNCLENRMQSIIIGYEHYHESLCTYISIGIPLGNQTVGLILPLQIVDANLLETYLIMPYKELFSAAGIKASIYPLGCHFFRKDIDAYAKCYERFLALSEQSHYLKVVTPYPQDAYLLAHAIHLNSVRKDKAFVYISDSQPTNFIEASIGDESFEGTLYVENFHSLVERLQARIIEMINCKSINSKADNCLYKSSTAIIINYKTNEGCHLVLPEVYAGLLDSMESYKLCIPSFQAMGDQFKLYLCSELEKICAEQGVQAVSLDEAVLNLFTQYHWPRGHADLESIADYHIKYSKNPCRMDVESIPEYIRNAKPMLETIPTLKEKEEEWIRSVLKLCKGNIKQSSKHLGITRTTLYKKIAEYQIEV